MESFSVPSKTHNKVSIKEYYIVTNLFPIKITIFYVLLQIMALKYPHLFAPSNLISMTAMTRHHTQFLPLVS